MRFTFYTITGFRIKRLTFQQTIKTTYGWKNVYSSDSPKYFYIFWKQKLKLPIFLSELDPQSPVKIKMLYNNSEYFKALK